MVIFFLAIIVTAARAQDDAAAALQKIYNSYNNGNTIKFAGNMKMYAKDNPAKIIDRVQSNYIIKNKQFSCRIGLVSMLLNNDYYVSVDHSDRLIMIGRKKDLSAVANAPVLNLDQIRKWMDGKKILARVDSKAGLLVLQPTGMDGSSGFTAYNIEYSTAYGYMKRCVLEMGNYNNQSGKTMVLEINYSAPVMVAADKGLFSAKPFFSIVHNKVQLTAAYKNYQVINQL